MKAKQVSHHNYARAKHHYVVDYLGRCDHLDGDFIQSLRRAMTGITYNTMQRALGPGVLAEWAKNFGYGRDLPLRGDFMVGYFKAWRNDVDLLTPQDNGKSVYYVLTWSGFEEVWMRQAVHPCILTNRTSYSCKISHLACTPAGTE
jgi:hypothetical protein